MGDRALLPKDSNARQPFWNDLFPATNGTKIHFREPSNPITDFPGMALLAGELFSNFFLHQDALPSRKPSIKTVDFRRFFEVLARARAELADHSDNPEIQ